MAVSATVITSCLTVVLLVCPDHTEGAGNVNTGSHQSMQGKVKVKHGGVQDFGGDDDPENQLKREEFVRNKE